MKWRQNPQRGAETRGTVLKDWEGVVHQSASHDICSYSMNFQMMSSYANIPWHAVSSSSLFTLCFPKWQSQWVGWKAEGRRLSQTLLTWVWPSVHPTGIYFFCSSKIGWETELGLINLQQIRADHGKRPSAENVWKCDSTTTDTILPDCGLVKGLQMRVTFWINRAPIRRCLIEMWIMNWNVIQSKLTLSPVEWVAPVRPLQRVRAGLLDFTFFFRSWFWWFKLQ